jgi:hypothetical protein
MKHSNLMIGILGIVLGAYTLIGLTERWGFAKSNKNQGWQDFQLKSIGENKFLLRRLEQSDHEVVVELQEDRRNARTVRFVGSDFLSPAGSGSGSGSYSYTRSLPYAATANLDGAHRGGQRRTGEVQLGAAAIR